MNGLNKDAEIQDNLRPSELIGLDWIEESTALHCTASAWGDDKRRVRDVGHTADRYLKKLTFRRNARMTNSGVIKRIQTRILITATS